MFYRLFAFIPKDRKRDVVKPRRFLSTFRHAKISPSVVHFRVKMNRSTTVLLCDLEEEKSFSEPQDVPLSIFRRISTTEKCVRSSSSTLLRSISDSVERNLCHRVGLHQVFSSCKKSLILKQKSI